MTGMRVLTYNILSRDHADGPRREKVLRAGIAALQPDVVALQEVTRSEHLDQARELLGPEYTIVDHPSQPPDPVGACLASRWPLGAVHSLDLHVTPQAGGLPWAAVVAVEVQAPDPLGAVLVVHYKPNWQLTSEYVRERQAVTAARWIEELVGVRADLPVVLLGDFDADAQAASIRFWTGRQSLDELSVRYEDAWESGHRDEPGHTFSPANPLVPAGEMKLERGRRIDYIMVRSGIHGPLLDVRDCRIVFDEPVDGVWVSDHFGLFAELVRPDRPVGEWD
ncbi:endonuclease/exonuclease/phosphatase family metal-dependent hydrolase [Kribbella voronezhensis]|uniref:Endonuclease/exonuclease/phosphatase family metal-dependent hydrolase n=1 Tax=Kribbella voronezhensis TaxID=2512212 RepID=A0A4R7SZE2_9ACTN|nr:endonuclease/exonuclease/phosphatase family protein [Kribbella voronezhensis]TDU83918.1 endonuclease/exonuclease/phosphatase family metal-dependent hydrolase [Kribbella voronezhensis]